MPVVYWIMGLFLVVAFVDLLFDLHKQNKDKGHNDDPPLGI